MMKNNIIYRHLKPCGEVFYIGIGKTKQRAYSKYRRNPHWKNIVNKYGYEVQILKEDLSWEEACELECLLIDYYGRKDLGLGPLVNMTDGGDGVIGHKHSDETRAKISKAHTGKKRSEEVKAKISKAHTGKTFSEEHRANLSKAQSGKKLSEEHKLKVGKARKGKKHTEEVKAKISKAMKGEKHHRAKKVINTETGVIYSTITEAAKKEGFKNPTLKAMLSGRNPNKTNLKFIKNEN